MKKQSEPQETTMAFRRCDLQEAFFVPGTQPFRVYGFGTADTLEEVLGPGYFAPAGSLLQPGQLIYVSARRRKRTSDPAPGEIHMALLMVAKAAERGGARSAPSVRLVQDFGCPEGIAQPSVAIAAPVPAAPVKRGRGRPPGSRNRKNGALPTVLVN
jgi:hypothetical protein